MSTCGWRLALGPQSHKHPFQSPSPPHIRHKIFHPRDAVYRRPYPPSTRRRPWTRPGTTFSRARNLSHPTIITATQTFVNPLYRYPIYLSNDSPAILGVRPRPQLLAERSALSAPPVTFHLPESRRTVHYRPPPYFAIDCAGQLGHPPHSHKRPSRTLHMTHCGSGAPMEGRRLLGHLSSIGSVWGFARTLAPLMSCPMDIASRRNYVASFEPALGSARAAAYRIAGYTSCRHARRLTRGRVRCLTPHQGCSTM